MRNIFIIIIFFSYNAIAIGGQNYYISSAGSDINNGLTPSTPWQSIAKANSFTFVAGDSILFKRGDTFYGGIIVKKAGLNFGAYGTGTKPVITGLSLVAGWVDQGGNIWEAPVSGVKADVNLVLRDNAIQQVGRYPNTDAANGGYITYTSSTPTSIVGPALSSVTNWTGAEVAIRSARWEIKRRKVNLHTTGVVSFATMSNPPKINNGYFFQRDPRTLDQDGEWWYNSPAKKIRMVFLTGDPSSYTTQIATIDTLFSSLYGSLSVSNLSFVGSGKYGIYVQGGSGYTIKDCDVTNSGGEGITAWFSSGVTVDGCTTNNSLGGGIKTYSSSSGAANLIIKNCTVNNTALFAGMEITDLSSSGKGIKVNGGSNIQITGNIVTNSGYNAIDWQGDNVTIRNNLVDIFCSVRDDGGGIYTYEGPGIINTVRSNRKIVGNIILHGIGAPYGAAPVGSAPADLLAARSASGIYLDEGTKTVTIDSNTIAYMPFHGVQGNGNQNINIRGNTVFSTPISHAFQRLKPEAPITGLTITGNIFYPFRFRFRDQAFDKPSPISQIAALQRMGTIDNNYYSTKPGTDTALILQIADSAGGNFSQIYRNFAYLTSAFLETHSTNVDNTGSLEYNASDRTVVIPFSGLSKKDLLGNVYNNSVTIAARGSMILIPNGSITPENIPPLANAGPDQTIRLPNNSLILYGSGTDADGTIDGYSWAKISGPAGGTIADASQANAVISDLQEGEYEYELTVTDNHSSTGSGRVKIKVNPAPTGPCTNCLRSSIRFIKQ